MPLFLYYKNRISSKLWKYTRGNFLSFPQLVRNSKSIPYRESHLLIFNKKNLSSIFLKWELYRNLQVHYLTNLRVVTLQLRILQCQIRHIKAILTFFSKGSNIYLRALHQQLWNLGLRRKQQELVFEESGCFITHILKSDHGKVCGSTHYLGIIRLEKIELDQSLVIKAGSNYF